MNRTDSAANSGAAVLWRSGSQIAGQMIARRRPSCHPIFSPADYGLYAMTQVMLMLFTGAERLWSCERRDPAVRCHAATASPDASLGGS